MNGIALVEAISLGMLASNVQLMALGDMNGDGNLDLILQNTVTQQVSVRYLNRSQTLSESAIVVLPVNWIVTGAADFDNDGNCDIAFRNTASGAATYWLMSGIIRVSTGTLASLPTSWVLAAPH